VTAQIFVGTITAFVAGHEGLLARAENTSTYRFNSRPPCAMTPSFARTIQRPQLESWRDDYTAARESQKT
jgi:hypothetical protein